MSLLFFSQSVSFFLYFHFYDNKTRFCGNRSANFVMFFPKKKFVRVSARFLEDSEKWMNKLQKAGFHVVGGTPGKSVRFRTTKREVVLNRKLLTQVFTEGYNARTGNHSD